MKFRPSRFLLALLVTSPVFVCCSGQSSKDRNLSVTPVEITLPGKACDATFTINSDEEWSLSCSDGSWIVSITPTFGSAGETAVILSVGANSETEPRTTTIIVNTASLSASVSVTQNGVSNYPARWLQTSTDVDRIWLSDTMCYATHGKGCGKAYITLDGTSCDPRLASSDSYISVHNLLPENSIEFVLPVSHVEAGTGVDLMVTMDSYNSENDVFKYYICEILDGGQWRENLSDLKIASEDPSLKYSFYIKKESDYQHSTFVQGFTLSSPAEGEIKARIRPVGDILANGEKYVEGKTAGSIGFVEEDKNPLSWVPCIMTAYENIPVKDSCKVAILGNSFTYYGGTAFMLRELARSQGHDIHIRAHVKGSQYFSDHLELEKSLAVIEEGGYDYAFLQDQSTQHSNYYDMRTASIKTNTVELINKLKAKSPSVKCFLENTWAYPKTSWMNYGSMDAFTNALYGGTKKLCDDADVDATLSPIGLAFYKAYKSGIKDLYYSDSKHPNRNGSYLKSCVNYLMLYGEAFDSNASDCGIDAAVAAELRDIAEQVVFNSSKEAVPINAVFRFDVEERAVALGTSWSTEISYSENGNSFVSYDIKENDLEISFTSSDESVATVDSLGCVTAEGRGKAMVIASSAAARFSDTLNVRVVVTEDEATFRNTSWDWKNLGKSASYAQVSMSIFSSVQSISIVKYPEAEYSTSVVYNPGEACTIVGTAVEAAGGSIAINGSYFNTTTFVSVVPTCVDGNILVEASPNDRVNGIVAFKDGKVSFSEYKALSDLDLLQGYDSFLGSGPLLVLKGATCDFVTNDFNDKRHPRSMVGVTADSTMVLVVVDGRFTGHAAGMTIPEMAKIAGYLDLTDAINLDGGGSSTLWTAQYGVLNHPSDNKTWDHSGCRACPTLIVAK